MTKQIENMRLNISLHKDIEKKLAKRAWKSQKLIASLKGSVEQLERQKKAKINDQGTNNLNAESRSPSPDQKTKARLGVSGVLKGKQGVACSDKDLQGEDLIDYLETKLEGIESRLATSQATYEELQQDCWDINDKLSRSKEKYKRAALMLCEFLEDLLSKKANILKETESKKRAASQTMMDPIRIEKFEKEQKDIERI